MLDEEIIIIDTERLILRKFHLSDALFVIALLNSPGFIQFIADRGVRTLDDAEKYLTNGILKNYATQNFGIWLVAKKHKKTPIGMCGLIKRDGLNDLDIGFAFLPEYMGNGYAYEAAKATLIYAKDRLQLARIVAITNVDNVASIKLLNKLKFSFDKLIILPNIKEQLNLFSINI